MGAGFSLRRAKPDDIAWIMLTERLDGYDSVVGRWDEDRHGREMTGSDCSYFVCEQDGAPAGFAILRGWDSPERVTLLKRIAVSRPGEGMGSRLLAAVTDAVFGKTDAHRLWLGVFPDNIRARRAYEKAGFVAEGITRGSAWFGGAHRDELTMAILRPEWEARTAR